MTDDSTADTTVLNEETHKLKETIKSLEEELKKRPKHGQKDWARNIIFNKTGFLMKKATPEQLEEAKMKAILARDYQIDHNHNVFRDKKGNPRKRFNECGNDMETVLKISTNGKLSGLGKSGGYPDLVNKEMDYYLECKVADADSLNTSFRSFYLSTLDKITASRAHILVCFKHHEGKLSKDDEPIIIDLYDIKLTMKCEWNASNKDIYS